MYQLGQPVRFSPTHHECFPANAKSDAHARKHTAARAVCGASRAEPFGLSCGPQRTERYGEAVWSATTPVVCAAIRLAPCPLGPRPSGRTQTIVHYGRGARVRGEGTEMAERLRSGRGRGQGATRSSLSELNVGEAWQHVHHCNAHARSGAHADVRTVRACEGSGSSRLQVGSAPTIPKFRALP